MWLVGLLACQAPFDLDRQDLVGFRVAAVEAGPVEDGLVHPRPAVVVDGRAWSTRPVDFQWFAVSDPDQVGRVEGEEPLAFGPRPALRVSDDQRWIGLRAESPSGEVARVALELTRAPPSLPEVIPLRSATLPLEVAEVTVEQVALDPRRRLVVTTEGPRIPRGGFARLWQELPEEEGLTRWMGTDGRFLALDTHVTDWAAGDVRLVDDEIEGTRELVEPGPITVLALTLGSGGDTSWQAAELLVGASGEGVWIGSRWLPTPSPPPDGEVLWGTLEADDESPCGLRLRDLVPLSLQEAEARAWGTTALDCTLSREGPFDPDWLLSQACTRSQLHGAEVAIQVGSS